MYMDDLKLFARTKTELETLINTTRIFSQDIQMEFGMEKCALLVMKKGKLETTEGMELPNQTEMRALGEQDSYKYLGVLEADTIKATEMKERIGKEYLRRTRKLLETKLYSRNLIKGINTWAVSLVRYSGPFIEWTKEELRQLDQKTRKLMTMHNALHPKDDVDRLYVKRKDGGRGLSSIEDCVNDAKKELEKYIMQNTERIIMATRTEKINKTENRETWNKTRKEKWEEKQLHGRFIRMTKDENNENTWTWMRKGHLSRETESLITAAQDNSIRTNHIKARIDKTQENSKCRLCGQRDETINHIVSECSKLAQKEYKNRHDQVGRAVHWELCKQLHLEHTDKWYKHKPATVLENENHKILWDMDIQTDKPIQARRPDVIIINKKEKFCQIVDFAVPADHRINIKEKEKRSKYTELARELKGIWMMKKIKIVPIIVGALGTIPKNFEKRMGEIGIRGITGKIQRITIMKTAEILRKTLECGD